MCQPPSVEDPVLLFPKLRTRLGGTISLVNEHQTNWRINGDNGGESMPLRIVLSGLLGLMLLCAGLTLITIWII
jgi:hypothetical protein